MVEGWHVVWCMQCSCRENAGTWFRTSTVCSPNHSHLLSPPPCHLTSLAHLATSPLSLVCFTLPPDPSLPHLPPPVPPCHLTPLPSSPPSFPPCHLTSPPYLSHLAASPLSPPFPPHHPSTIPNLPPHHPPTFPTLQLTTLPSFQPSQLTTLPPSQLVTLVLRDLTVTISITTNRISHGLTEARPFPCNTSLRLQIPHTSSSPKPHIHSIPSVLTSFE